MFNRKVITGLFLGLIVILGLIILPISKRNIKADGYATSWNLAEGNGFRVISGNIGTNTDGNPYVIDTGQDSVLYVQYALTPANPTDPDWIQAGKFGIKIKIPSSFTGNISRPDSPNWTFSEGNATDPNGTPSGSDRYFYLINTVDMPVTASELQFFTLKPFLNGITADGSVLPIAVSVINLNNDPISIVGNEKPTSFIANTATLWGSANVTIATAGGNQNKSVTPSQHPQQILLDPLTFTLNSNKNYAPNQLGVSYAQSLTFTNTYDLPMDTDGITPLIKVDASMFYKSDGITPLETSDYELITNGSGKVTGFKIHAKVNNPSSTDEFINPSFTFKIIGAKIDGTAPILSALLEGESKSFNITQSEAKHFVEPLVTLDSSVVLEDGKKVLSQPSMAPLPFSYTVKVEETELDSYKAPVKYVTRIADKATTGMAIPYSAYADDTIIYELGYEHIKNNNTTPISAITYTEEANASTGYDKTRLLPMQIKAGVVSNTSTLREVTIKYSASSSKPDLVINFTANCNVTDNGCGANSMYNIPANDRDLIESISIKYVNLGVNVQINTGTLISYKLINQDDLALDNSIVKNTVQSSFKKNDDSTPILATSNVDIKYKLKPFNNAGLFESDKTGLNLAGNGNGRAHPVSGDVIEFIIMLTNDHGSALHVDKIIDHYSSNLEAYNGVDNKVVGGTPIDSRLVGSIPNNMNLVLWTVDPRLGTSTPTPISTSYTLTDNPSDNTFKIVFDNDIVVPSGKTYYFTYTMSVKQGNLADGKPYNFFNSAMGNTFNAYEDGLKNFEGVFYWGGGGPGGSSNKYHKNASTPNTIKNPWYSNPYSNDVITYVTVIKNDSNVNWSDSNMEFVDTFDGTDLEFITGTDGINTAIANPNISDTDKLNFSAKYNFNALKGPLSYNGDGSINDGDREYATVRESTGVVSVGTTAPQNTFNPSLVNVQDVNTTDNTFKVLLGSGNVIKPGEQVVFIYNLKVKNSVLATDSNENDTLENDIINNFNVVEKTTGNIAKHTEDWWYINAKENIQGYIDLTKAPTSIVKQDGLPGNTARVENGDEVNYKVSISNDHIKANRFVKFQTLQDKLPSNLIYKPNSFSLTYYKIDWDTSANCGGDGVNQANLDSCINGTGTKTVLGTVNANGLIENTIPTGAANFTVTYIDTDGDSINDTINVQWANPIELTAGNFTSTSFQKITTYAFEFNYTAIADTSTIPENEVTRNQTNNVSIFLNNKDSELIMKNGSKFDDTTTNKDNNSGTEAGVSNSANITMINDNFYYGKIQKGVLSGPTNVYYIDQTTYDGRTYYVDITNTGARSFTLSAFADIMPEYETFKDGTFKIDNVAVDENKITKGTYTNAQSIANREKIVYKNDIIIPVNSTVRVTYETSVDTDSVYQYLVSINRSRNVNTLVNSSFIFMKNDANLTLGTGIVITDVNDDLDNDVKTTKAYQSDYGFVYKDESIAPAINYSPKIILSDGTFSDYIPNITPINPGDSLGWQVKVGNGNNVYYETTSTITAGSKIVVVLPEGVLFNGEYVASTNANVGTTVNPVVNTTRPSWLDEPTMTTNSNNQQVIVWNVNTSFSPYSGSAGIGQFVIKTSTEQFKYTTYTSDAYFIPLQNQEQDFYTNYITDTSNALNNNNWNFVESKTDISNLVSELTGLSHYVKAGAYVDVYGAYGLSSIKKVMYDANQNGSYDDPGDVVTSRDSDRLLTLASRSSIVTYSLKLEAVKNDTIISGMSFIDRLPSLNDKSVVSNTNRGSQADVRLEGNGNVRVVFLESNVSTPITLNNTQYTIEYFFGSANEAFTIDDKDGVAQPNRWYSESDALSANKPLNTATALRVNIIDNNIVIRQLGNIEILFDAHLGQDVTDYNTKDAKGVNNFGYKLDYGNAKNLLRAEAVSVDLAADVPDAQATIVKNIDLDSHTDSVSRAYFTSIAKNQNFNFTLVGRDTSNDIVYTHNIDLSATTSTSDGYTGQTTITGLDPGLSYTLSEANNPNFTKEITLSSILDGDQTQYTFTATNTWHPKKIEVEKVWKDAKGNVINSSDINTLLGAYQSGNVTVDLYNGANVSINSSNGAVTAQDDASTTDIDESTLNVNALKIKSDSISLTDLQADLGYVNEYNDAGTKINYDVNEGSGLNYSYFSVTKSYVESGTTEKIGKFTLNNQIGGGDFELTKKDDLNNVLSGVEFTLTDPLGNTYTYITTNEGKFSISNMNPGTYSLSETNGKVGYTPITTPISFTIEPNASSAITKEVINPIIRGSVELLKEDDIGNIITGATFDLYSKDGTKINSSALVTNSSGLINVNNLIPNDYYFVETSAPAGYTLVSGHIDFKIILNPSATVSLKAVDPIIRGSVELTKKDDLGNVLGGDVYTKYGGTTFELYDSKANKIGTTYTTDITGKLIVNNLLPGNYYFKEINAPVGYTKDDNNINFSIVNNPKNVVELEAVNDIIRGSVELSKESDLKTKLSNVEFELYDKDNNKIGSTYVSDEDGLIIVDNLIPNDYYFKEVKGIEGYALDDSNIDFSIVHNPTKGTNIQVHSINDVIRGGVILTLFDDKDQVIPGATFDLYSVDGKLIGSKIMGSDTLLKTSLTDDKGEILINELVPGDYYFVQTKTTDDYLMNEDDAKNIYYFNIPINHTGLITLTAYNYSPLEIDPPIKKVVLGDDAKVTIDDVYTFEMVGSEKAPMPIGSNDDKKIMKAKAGEVEFGYIKFTKIGTYTYHLSELSGDTDKCHVGKNTGCMMYDESSYDIIVTISLSDDRRLVSEVQYLHNNEDISENDIIFKNVYIVVSQVPIDKPIVKTGHDDLLISCLLLIGSIGLIPLYRKH
ncbi:MAG: hypothetical protein LBT75_03320 [Bacilli bacterium]|jgi:pilin isopeptide linkage protein|nr:hypothetical protein [Bacilli bacterium]